MRHFVIATAGHVDHGKSALVKALTGTDPDRLPEEKARSITIDLGFAHLDLVSDNGEECRVGIVDVPGHEDFVRNMIAGVGSIDLALLVVAADDGWMPQTEEHVQILQYLGVKRVLIALTKSDLGATNERVNEIQRQLAGTVFENSPIIPVSARTGSGIAELKTALARALSQLNPPFDAKKPRLFVDRAFSLRGIGTVVTGTLTGGSLKRGETVVVQPSNLKARVRSLQCYGRDVDLARPVTRLALNLPELELGETAREIRRGEVISAEAFTASDTLDVLIIRSARRAQTGANRVLKNGAAVDLHHGTARTPATLSLLDAEALRPGESGIAQLRLTAPLPAFLGDHLILRDRSQQQTLAGAIVLDPDGNRRQFRSERQRKFLLARATNLNDLATCLLSEIERGGAIFRAGLLAKSSFSADDIAETLKELETREQIVIRGVICAAKEHWSRSRERAISSIDAAHQAHPDRRGFELSSLRASLAEPLRETSDAVITDLCQNGFVQSGEIIARKTHHAELPPALEEAAGKLLVLIGEHPLDPPAAKQLAADNASKQALRFLVSTGTVVELAPDVVMLRTGFDQAKNQIRNYIAQHGGATVSALRQELQSSRRIMVPLLERLDREKFTRRVGDKRVLVTN